MTTIEIVENMRQYENNFSLIVEQIITLDSNPSRLRGVKNLPPNFKQIVRRCCCY